MYELKSHELLMSFELRPVHSKQQRYTILRAGGSKHLIPMISTRYEIEAKCHAADRKADHACMHVLLVSARTRHILSGMTSANRVVHRAHQPNVREW